MMTGHNKCPHGICLCPLTQQHLPSPAGLHKSPGTAALAEACRALSPVAAQEASTTWNSIQNPFLYSTGVHFTLKAHRQLPRPVLFHSSWLPYLYGLLSCASEALSMFFPQRNIPFDTGSLFKNKSKTNYPLPVLKAQGKP